MSKNIKDLRAFMRESMKEDKFVSAQGPETIKDENGETVVFEFKVLSMTEQDKIRKNYTKKSVAFDEKGKAIVGFSNEVAFKTEYDSEKAGRHLLVEALVYPNLKDPDLMKFFNCHDITEMPMKVFTQQEFLFVFDLYNKIQAGENITPAETSEIIDEIKN